MKTIEERENKCAYNLRVIGHDCERTVKEAYSRSAKEQHQIDINKAVEWLNANWRKYIETNADGMVRFAGWKNDFIKAMNE